LRRRLDRDLLRACVGKSLSGLESQLDLELTRETDGWGRREGGGLGPTCL
jgi:hypothetical protein